MNYYILEWTEKSKLFAIVKANTQEEAVKKWQKKTGFSVYDNIESFNGKPSMIYFIGANLFIE